MQLLVRTLVPTIMVLAGLAAGHDAIAQDAPAGDAGLGQVYFQQACAICHSATLGPGNSVIVKQGPCLVGLVGRRAGTSLSFNYTKALSDSGIVWSPTTLDKFLQNPMLAVPGTIMPMPVPDDTTRRNLIAYLATMAVPPGVTLAASITPAPVGTPSYDPGDWRNAAPGVTHHITVADLPAPYSTVSSGNNPRVVRVPTNAVLSVPPGFTVRRFATGFSDPRLLCVAPNGDIFIAETRANRIRVLRAVDGADAPTDNQIYATNLDRPFGIAFYPPGNDPQWVYVANNNSVVRFPYHRGDLTASGDAQVIVPHLADTTGGHTTRTLAFSNDGQCLFISVGSGSNVAEDMSKKNPADTAAWAATHVLGEAWDADVNRADVLVADPEGKQPLQIYAAGIRNGAGLAVNPVTGELWTASNERDALGDNLVPDYLTRVKPGGFYGWPWYYLGNHEDPRHAGERPDLAGSVTVPDVLFQSHSAPLEIAFYTASNGVAAFPAEYRGDVFVAFHGSWNRSLRTGYKVVWVHVDHGVPTGEYDDFMTGFVLDNRNVWGRPVGVAVAHDGALLVTDDGGNAVWRVAYTGH